MKKRHIILICSLTLILLIVASMKDSISLIIASFFALIFTIAEAINQIHNKEVKKLVKNVSGAYLVTSGAFDMPLLVIVGMIFGVFYNFWIFSKIILQGKFLRLLNLLKAEKEFIRIFKTSIILLVVGVLLAYYERFVGYVALVSVLFVVAIIKTAIRNESLSEGE